MSAVLLGLLIALLSIHSAWLAPAPPQALALLRRPGTSALPNVAGIAEYEIGIGKHIPHNLALYFVSTSPVMTVTLNGKTLFSRHAPTMRFANALPMPFFDEIDPDLLHSGTNILKLTDATSNNNKNKITIFLGENSILRNIYFSSVIFYEIIPKFSAVIFICAAIIFVLIYHYLTRHLYFLLFAVIFGIFGGRVLLLYFPVSMASATTMRLALLSPMLQSGLMLPAIDGYLNQKIRRSFFYFAPVILIMPLAALAVLLNAPNSWAFTIFIIYVFLCYLICFYFIFKSSIHSANLDNVILLIPCAFVLVMMYNQLVARFNGEAASVGAGISIANGLLLTIAFRLLRRSIAAVRAVDSTNVRIAEELRLAEIRINEALTEQHRREQSILLQTEREQLMRELHDGVGNHLISAMAMCRTGSSSLQQVDQMLHDTMSELRLALTAMNGDEGELAEGIASFLPQLRRQVRPFGVVVECDVADLPATPWMRPMHLQHVLRLVQEAVMNAAKHSGSPLVRIDGRADHPCLTVRDYGRGGAEPRDGSYGFQIMQRRADDLGARLDVASGSDGTIVTLCLLPADHGDCAGVSGTAGNG
ncbi:MAG: hypothetical protein WCL10_19650 [Novosphingobium sp.]|uniref:sensor histidine kinase n=1 Tax=Novosphingobium sp. TaxID=1874826 RepID=UPI00301AA8BD